MSQNLPENENVRFAECWICLIEITNTVYMQCEMDHHFHIECYS